MKKIFRPGMTLWLLLFCLPSLAAPTDNSPLIVFAAASLTNALQEVGDEFEKDSSIPVKFSIAASFALARQIENGAPADVFFSADIEWMDYLQNRKLIRNHTRHNVLGNRLVLVAPADSNIVLKIEPHFPLAATLGEGRLSTGDPDSVPVGRYAREALTKLDVWNDIEARLVRADSVRSAQGTRSRCVSRQHPYAHYISHCGYCRCQVGCDQICGLRPRPDRRRRVQEIRLHGVALEPCARSRNTVLR